MSFSFSLIVAFLCVMENVLRARHVHPFVRLSATRSPQLSELKQIWSADLAVSKFAFLRIGDFAVLPVSLPAYKCHWFYRSQNREFDSCPHCPVFLPTNLLMKMFAAMRTKGNSKDNFSEPHS